MATIVGGILGDYLAASSGAENYVIDGREGNDSIVGSGGSDVLISREGHSTIDGGQGDDTLFGGEGNDLLEGALSGNKALYGGAGQDRIFAGDVGSDTLVGGTGADFLYGALGDFNHYVFNENTDGGVGQGNRDTIWGFSPERGVIEFTGGNALSFVGESEFSGTGGEIRYTDVNTYNKLVQVDTDGDGTTDFEIELASSNVTLTAEDFVLLDGEQNVAPVLIGHEGLTVAANDADPAGSTVAELLGNQQHVYDYNGDTVGIAVTGADNTGGIWQYNTGSGWVDMNAAGALSETSALLLSDAASLRFVPDSGLSNSLSHGLVSHWSLNEASGGAQDALGLNHLSEVNAVGSGSGIIAGARDFSAGKMLTGRDNASLDTDNLGVENSNFSFSVWVKPDTTNGYPVIFSKGWEGAQDANSEYVLYLQGGVPAFAVHGDNGTTIVKATDFGALNTGEWANIVVWRDGDNGEIGITVNDTATNVASHTGRVNNGTDDFIIGGSPTQNLYFDGEIDEVSLWNRVLSDAEKADLYNNGDGQTYAGDTTGDITIRAWDQTDGAEGDRADVSVNGGDTAFSAQEQTVEVHVGNVAPVLTGYEDFPDVFIGDTDPDGHAVASLIDGHVSDSDGDVSGIAVVDAYDAGGVWQYNTGSGWQGINTFSKVSETNALLLSEDAQVRFVPNGEPVTTLTQGLVSQWNMDGGGFVLDGPGDNHLLEAGGSNSYPTTGKVGGARDLNAYAQDHFTGADNASFDVSNADFSFSVWVKPDTTSGYPVIFSKGWEGGQDANSEYVLYLHGGVPSFAVHGDDGTTIVKATNFGALNTGEWANIVVWRDANSDEIGIRVNDSATNVKTHTGGVSDGTDDFIIGASPTQNLYFDGKIDEVSFWNRVLMDEEKTSIYNDGEGVSYFANNTEISFRAWDQSSGIEGEKVNASVNGGDTAFSAERETSSLTVTANSSLTFTPGGTDDFDGGLGDDTFTGAAENFLAADTVIGDVGNDVLEITSGALDISTSTYTNLQEVENWNFSNLTAVNVNIGDEYFNRGNGLEDNTLTIEGTNNGAELYNGSGISSSNHNLFINANEGDDTIFGGAGNDTLYGDGTGNFSVGGVFSDNDLLRGGAGDDYIHGGGGDDTVYGDAGDDTLNGYTGTNYVDGGEGDDFVSAGGTNNTLLGGAGNDVVRGSGLLSGENGDDDVRSFGENSTLSGGDGNDTLVGNEGVDSLDGGVGDDYILGDRELHNFTYQIIGGNDTLNGGDGNDTMEGGDGDDVLDGGAGNDYMLGDYEHIIIPADFSIGGAAKNSDDYFGNDLLDGGDGDDTLVGGGGDDTLTGGEGNDKLYGDGDDFSVSGALVGNDLLEGGDGDDYLFGGNGQDTLLGGNGNDHISSVSTSLLEGGDGDDTLSGGENSTLDGGHDDDYIYGNGLLLGDLGDDTLIASGDNSTLDGGAGDDIIAGSSSVDFIIGGHGDDTLYGDGEFSGNILFSRGDVDDIHGGTGNDYIEGGDGGDEISGSFGDDYIYGDYAHVFIPGDPAIPNFSIGGADVDSDDYFGNDLIDGDEGDDTIIGGGGDDTLYGGEDNDFIAGEDGNDLLVGGEGGDVIDGGAGFDVIDLTETVAARDDVIIAGSTDSRDVISGFSGGANITTNDNIDTSNVALEAIGIGTGAVNAFLSIATFGVDSITDGNNIFVFEEVVNGALTAANIAAGGLFNSTADIIDNETAGDSALFVFNNGADTAIYLFTSAAQDDAVNANELSLLATLSGVTSDLVAGDFI